MSSYFRANLSMKYAMVFEHAELKVICCNADDGWIKLEHAELIRRAIQAL